MEPLSKNKRRGYLFFFSVVFVICVPVFILYAKGYRFDINKAFQISETGGLYINTDQSGISIYVNGDVVRKTSIIQKSVFVQSLKPGTYEVSVSKDAFQTWNKTLKVFPEIVTEARSFSLKAEPTLNEIHKNLTSGDGSTTSPSRAIVKNPEYALINALFATSTQKVIKIRNVLVKNESGLLHVSWTGENDSIPNYFCESSVCKREIIINSGADVASFDFFPGRDDLLIIRLGDGIYVSEIDDRSPQNIQSIVPGAGYDFRVKDWNEIYLKKDAKIYSVAL